MRVIREVHVRIKNSQENDFNRKEAYIGNLFLTTLIGFSLFPYLPNPASLHWKAISCPLKISQKDNYYK